MKNRVCPCQLTLRIPVHTAHGDFSGGDGGFCPVGVGNEKGRLFVDAVGVGVDVYKRQGFACPHCGGRHFEKETDTLDGWFDSGSTHFASMQKDQGFWPATVYIEGLDQYRGWFQSSLLTAVGALGKGAPFKECVTHGWTVDGEGKAMHKSLGNGVDPCLLYTS